MKYRKQQFVKDTCGKLARDNLPTSRQTKKVHDEKARTRLVKARSLEKIDLEYLSQPLKELPRMNMRKVFVVFSRIHWGLELRFNTLFLALEIYLKYTKKVANPEEMIPEDCLLVVCMFLAMKYEEIYYPGLKEVCFYLRLKLTLEDYKKYEVDVLLKLNGNLNIPTASHLLEEQLKGKSKGAHFHGYYFLEMVYTHQSLVQDYSLDVIVKSIANIMNPPMSMIDSRKGDKKELLEIEKCSIRLILEKQKLFNS